MIGVSLGYDPRQFTSTHTLAISYVQDLNATVRYTGLSDQIAAEPIEAAVAIDVIMPFFEDVVDVSLPRVLPRALSIQLPGTIRIPVRCSCSRTPRHYQ